MKNRVLGKTNIELSEISLGCWQLGSKWGDPFNEIVAIDTMKAALESGITCFDTADVYQDGLSEKIIGTFNQTQETPPFVITKIGRKLPSQSVEHYTEESIRKYIDDSRKSLQVSSLDMVLLHCPSTDVYYNPAVFKCLDAIKAEGKIKHYGVSVERIEEGLKAMEYEGVEAIEIIFNMFRLRPSELFFEQAKKKNVGVIVRVPLASGLLSGKFNSNSTFGKDDHRHFNRDGAAFDKGETFSGVDYETGLLAVDAIKKAFPNKNIVSLALRWILMFDAVSTVIPGASKHEHIVNNAKASELPPLTKSEMKKITEIYNKYIKEPVHYLW